MPRWPVKPTTQHVTFKNERSVLGTKATSTSSSDDYAEDDYDDETDEAPQVRRLNQLPFTAPVQTKGSHAPNSLFKPDFSRFHDAFRRSFSITKATPPVVAESANRSAVTNTNASRKQRPRGQNLTSASAQNDSSVVPAKRAASSVAESSKRIKSKNGTPAAAKNHRSTPNQKGSVERNAHSVLPKGTGIYKTGNWDYVPGDQTAEVITSGVMEISAITEASTQKPSKITRNSYRRLKSTLEGSSATTTPSQEPPTESRAQDSAPTKAISTARISPQPDITPRRRSNRARAIPDYSTYLVPEIDEEAIGSGASPREHRTPSTPNSPISPNSIAVLDQSSRSTSASTVVQPDSEAEELTKPKKSWTEIVYETLANARTLPLTLPEIIEEIKDRYPYFRLQASSETLKSSPRNPLYMHPAFHKTQCADNTIAWSLNPGKFYDKRTNKLLTPGSPRPRPIPSATSTKVSSRLQGQRLLVTLNTKGDHAQTSKSENQLRRSTSPQAGSPVLKEDKELVISKPLVDGSSKSAEADRPNENVETQLSLNSSLTDLVTPATREDTSDTSVVNPSEPSAPLPSAEQGEIPSLSHQNLKETFTASNLNRFIQETKVVYFKELKVTQEDISRILRPMFSEGLLSSDDDLKECAGNLQAEYEECTWAADWLLQFVSDEVTRFDTNMQGFMRYMDKLRPVRLEFWLGPSKWNRLTFTKLFADFSDAIDISQVWSSKHWNDCVMKLFSTACDAIWIHRVDGPLPDSKSRMLQALRANYDDRYPDRTSKVWEVPLAGVGRPVSGAGSSNLSRPRSTNSPAISSKGRAGSGSPKRKSMSREQQNDEAGRSFRIA